jgi:hypothetical protein
MAFVRHTPKIERWLGRLQGKQLPGIVVTPIPYAFDRDAVPLLQELVTDDDPNVRRNAQLALDSLIRR